MARSDDGDGRRRFDEEILPHLDAAYNLARWLTRNDHDAQDVVQEAFLRACRFFAGFKGENARAWLLSIVRNTCYTWLKAKRPDEVVWAGSPDGDWTQDDLLASIPSDADDPEMLLIKSDERDLLNEAIAALPVEFREVLVLRELEEMSYKEIADTAGVPIGTVMSRLSRARRMLRRMLETGAAKGSAHGL